MQVPRVNMEQIFSQTVKEVQNLVGLSREEMKILEDVDSAASELLEYEYQYYLEHRYNEKIPEILSKYDLMGIPILTKYQGRGARPIVHALAMERLGQVGMGVVTFADVHQFLGSLTIQQWGNEEQKQRYLPKAAKGSIVLAFALTEPEAGSDPSSMLSTYSAKDGRYYITGSKYLISNGSVADNMIVFARGIENSKEISAFILDTKSRGFKVEMKLLDKPGLFTSDTALLSMEEVEVSKEDLLGKEGKGLSVAYSALLNGRIGIGAGCVGVMDDCLKQVKERSINRVQHGKAIAKHQLIQKHIAKIASELEASRWLVYRAALQKEKYDKSPEDIDLRLETDRMSAIAKYTASNASFDVADRAMQIFGGFGYNLFSPVTRHFLDTRVARIYEGTDEIMELKIASTILGKEYEAYR
ncbi:MAG: acyl-CoA dehydrogenase family protein [Conexivisphaerales archaeon]